MLPALPIATGETGICTVGMAKRRCADGGGGGHGS